MTGTEVVETARDAIMAIVVISAPLLIIGTLVGVAISLLQALTQIQEQTLIYVPKILATFVVFLFALPFMADALNNYMMRMASLIALQR
jgi:flagellar biosynthetic protein FliQ